MQNIQKERKKESCITKSLKQNRKGLPGTEEKQKKKEILFLQQYQMPKEQEQKGQESYENYKQSKLNQLHVYSRSPCESCINLVTSLFSLLGCCTAALAEVIFGNKVGEGRWLGKLQDIQEEKHMRILNRTHKNFPPPIFFFFFFGNIPLF